jgi:hypothetical protein
LKTLLKIAWHSRGVRRQYLYIFEYSVAIKKSLASMLTLFGKKKLTEEQVANVFVNAVQSLIDSGFEDMAGLINDSPEFLSRPSVGDQDLGAFTLVVLAGNLQSIPQHFEAGQDKRITEHILEKFAGVYDTDKMELARMVSEMRKFMARKNHPSKNVPTGMAKALFCRYGLNKYQDTYFKNLDVPNPIFIQRLKEGLDTFMWDWTAITQKYRIV